MGVATAEPGTMVVFGSTVSVRVRLVAASVALLLVMVMV